MRLIATLPARNEAWVLGFSLRVALMWCDAVVVLNHASTDETGDILSDAVKEYSGRVVVKNVGADSWAEMAHRQLMLEMARKEGATHIAIVDSDEILVGPTLPIIRQLIEETPSYNMLQLPIYNMRGTIDRYHLTGIWGNRTVTVAFKDEPIFNWQGDQFHHREPFGVPEFRHQPMPQGAGGVMHLWGVTERRLIQKHRAYKCSERIRWAEKPISKIDAYYNWAIYESASVCQFGEWTFADTPVEWLAPYRNLMDKYYRPDTIPWQEEYVNDLIKEHGASKFQGLDLFSHL